MRPRPPTLPAAGDGGRRVPALVVALVVVLSPVVFSTGGLHAAAAGAPPVDSSDARVQMTDGWTPPSTGIGTSPPSPPERGRPAPRAVEAVASAVGGANVTEDLDATLDTSRSVLGVDVAVTPSGEYVVAGRTALTNGADAFVARVARNGTVEWTETFGSAGLDWFTGVGVTGGGDVVAVGSSRSRATPDAGNSTDGYAVRLRGNGSVVWERAYGGDDAAWLNDASVRNGVVTAVGYRTETNSGTGGEQLVRHGWFLRFDVGSGNVRTDRTYTHYGTERFFALKRLAGGGFAVTGSADRRVDTEVKRDIYVAGLDDDGDTRWTTTVGDRNEDIGNDVAIAPSGDPIVVGWSDESEENRSDDAVFARVSPDGQGGADVRWTRYRGTPATDVGHQVVRVGDRIVATTYPGVGTDGDRVARTYRLTPNGSVTSLGYTGSREGEYFLGALATGPSTLVLTGATSSVASDDDGPYDPFVTRLRLSGSSVDGPSPTARFDYAPKDVSAGVPVTFETNASDEGVVMVREWDFGDGSSANGADVTHTFNSSGTYTVTLTVTDNTGRQDTVSTTIRVAPPPSEQFDGDGDGLEQDELRDALENVTGSGGAAAGDNATTNASDGGNASGDVNVGEARAAIDDYISNASTDDPLAGAPNRTVDTDADGLSNWLEKRGVPVLNTYNLSRVGDDTDLAPSLDTDAPDIERLDTDPLDSDTDDDGISDGQELGAKQVTSGPRGQQYFVLKSDPTDANTDDAGVDDEEELKKGSDPRKPTWFDVNAILPVVGEEGCDVENADGSANNCAKEVEDKPPTYVVKPDDEYNHDTELGSASPPTWLQRVDDDALIDDRTYYLIRVKVTASANVFDTGESRPYAVRFTGLSAGTIVGQGTSKSDVKEQSIELYGGHGNERTVYLAVRSSGRRLDIGDQKYVQQGKLEMTVVVPDGPMVRGRDPSPNDERATLTSGHAFAIKNVVPDTNQEQARLMVQEAAQKFAKNTVSSVVPSGGALAGQSVAAFSTSGAAIAAEVYVEGVTLFTGVGKAPNYGHDDLIGKAIAGDGAVPAYLDDPTAETPTTNVVVTLYRAN